MFNFIFMPYDDQVSTGMKIPWKVARELQSGFGLYSPFLTDYRLRVRANSALRQIVRREGALLPCYAICVTQYE